MRLFLPVYNWLWNSFAIKHLEPCYWVLFKHLSLAFKSFPYPGSSLPVDSLFSSEDGWILPLPLPTQAILGIVIIFLFSFFLLSSFSEILPIHLCEVLTNHKVLLLSHVICLFAFTVLEKFYYISHWWMSHSFLYLYLGITVIRCV